MPNSSYNCLHRQDALPLEWKRPQHLQDPRQQGKQHALRFLTPWFSQCITLHHWAVYDFTRTITCGHVTTYKDICIALGQGSPQSGAHPKRNPFISSSQPHLLACSVLQNNPFAPFVPCHRWPDHHIKSVHWWILWWVGHWHNCKGWTEYWVAVQ